MLINTCNFLRPLNYGYFKKYTNLYGLAKSNPCEFQKRVEATNIKNYVCVC